MMPVWQTMLDEKYECTVDRTDDAYMGRLTVRNVETNEYILDDLVTLSYGAQFGPDYADVLEWQQRCLMVVDNGPS